MGCETLSLSEKNDRFIGLGSLQYLWDGDQGRAESVRGAGGPGLKYMRALLDKKWKRKRKSHNPHLRTSINTFDK